MPGRLHLDEGRPALLPPLRCPCQKIAAGPIVACSPSPRRRTSFALAFGRSRRSCHGRNSGRRLIRGGIPRGGRRASARARRSQGVCAFLLPYDGSTNRPPGRPGFAPIVVGGGRGGHKGPDGHVFCGTPGAATHAEQERRSRCTTRRAPQRTPPGRGAGRLRAGSWNSATTGSSAREDLARSAVVRGSWAGCVSRTSAAHRGPPAGTVPMRAQRVHGPVGQRLDHRRGGHGRGRRAGAASLAGAGGERRPSRPSPSSAPGWPPDRLTRARIAARFTVRNGAGARVFYHALPARPFFRAVAQLESTCFASRGHRFEPGLIRRKPPPCHFRHHRRFTRGRARGVTLQIHISEATADRPGIRDRVTPVARRLCPANRRRRRRWRGRPGRARDPSDAPDRQ